MSDYATIVMLNTDCGSEPLAVYDECDFVAIDRYVHFLAEEHLWDMGDGDGELSDEEVLEEWRHAKEERFTLQDGVPIRL